MLTSSQSCPRHCSPRWTIGGRRSPRVMLGNQIYQNPRTGRHIDTLDGIRHASARLLWNIQTQTLSRLASLGGSTMFATSTVLYCTSEVSLPMGKRPSQIRPSAAASTYKLPTPPRPAPWPHHLVYW
jgi:hypothetical protein